MAKQLARFGVAALKPQLVNGAWHKPKISARVAADLKKQFEREGKEWPLPEEPKKGTKWGFGLKRKPKGHKHDKLAAQRQLDIQANMATMDKKIADYREAVRKQRETVSVYDRLFLTAKERRIKQTRGQK